MRLSTKSDVVNALGGINAVATLTKRNYPAVQMWLRRRFPPETYLMMMRALQERGHEAPDALWGMQQRKTSKRAGGQTKAGRRMSTLPDKRRAEDFIREHYLAFGKGPTMRDITESLGLVSTSQAHRLVVDLEIDGRIRRPRSLGGLPTIVPVPVSAAISIELPAALYAAVDAVARQTGVSLASVVVDAVGGAFGASETPLQKRMAASRKAWRSRKRAEAA